MESAFVYLESRQRLVLVASPAQLPEATMKELVTAEETAEALSQSVHVVRHDLRLAQAWLRRKLSG